MGVKLISNEKISAAEKQKDLSDGYSYVCG